MSFAQNKPPTLLDVVDNDTRDGIMRLHQKLKGIQAEIATKLEFLTTDQKADDLHLLSTEIDKALQSINALIRTEIAEGITPAQFAESNQAILGQFRDMVKSNSEKMTAIGDSI